MLKSIEGNFDNLEVHKLLTKHFIELRSVSPEGSTHVLDIAGLKDPSIKFWSLWEKNDLMGCGALKFLDKKHGEFSFVDSIMKSSAIDQKLSYLPLIISGYQRRNKGIWNLNFITGSSNLQINHYIDERIDVKKSTICAVAYLKFLTKKYKSNNWVMLAFLTSPSYVSNVLNSSKSINSPVVDAPPSIASCNFE